MQKQYCKITGFDYGVAEAAKELKRIQQRKKTNRLLCGSIKMIPLDHVLEQHIRADRRELASWK